MERPPPLGYDGGMHEVIAGAFGLLLAIAIWRLFQSVRYSVWSLLVKGLMSPLLICSLVGMFLPVNLADRAGSNPEGGRRALFKAYETLPMDIVLGTTAGFAAGMAIDAALAYWKRRQKSLDLPAPPATH